MLFIDSDILINGSLQNLWDTPMEGHAMAAPANASADLISFLQGEQFLYSRKIPFTATVSEHGHGRDTTWTLRAKQAPDFITEAWPGSRTNRQVARHGWDQAGMGDLTRLSISPGSPGIIGGF